MVAHALPTDPDRPYVIRNELLSTSAAAASAPQAAFQVTTLADVVDASDGFLSLREAARDANATVGQDTITFAPDLLGGKIELRLGTLVVTDDLAIDGDPGNGGPAGIILDGAAKYDVDDPRPDPDPISGAATLFGRSAQISALRI